MADTTYADALAALRAECGEPTGGGGSNGVRMADWPAGAGGVCLAGGRGVVVLSAHESYDVPGPVVRWTLAGDAPLTPLADAVRDAGAWLRGAR